MGLPEWFYEVKKYPLVEGNRIREGTLMVPPPPASREFIQAHTLLGKYETPPLSG